MPGTSCSEFDSSGGTYPVGYSIFVWDGFDWEFESCHCAEGYESPNPPDFPGAYLGQTVKLDCVLSE